MLKDFLKNPSGGSAGRDSTHKGGGRGREVCQSILPYLERYRQQGLGFGRDEPMRRNLKILTVNFFRTFLVTFRVLSNCNFPKISDMVSFHETLNYVL